jgi:hypothetical protein
MSEISPQEFGRLQAAVVTLENDMREMKSDVRIIRDAVTEAKGGWRLLLALGGAAAAAASAVTWALQHVTFK